MEYVYAAMLLHKAGQKIDEVSLTKVVGAAGVKADAGQAKAVASALQGVDIEKVTSQPLAMQAAAPAHGAEPKKEEKKEEKKAEEKKSEEAAAAGLGALFG